MTYFHAHGKLLLTAEYFVLDGAQALAMPVRLGQGLEIGEAGKRGGAKLYPLHWRSLDENGGCWFEAGFDLEGFSTLQTTDPAIAARLQKMLQEARILNPNFLLDHAPITAHCQLQFPRFWGLGSSSTLIHLVSQWAEINPFELSARTFGGSGYDVACAGASGPILYQLANGKPHIERSGFSPTFRDSLYFIYLGQKQDSREGIRRYRSAVSASGFRLPEMVGAMSDLTLRMAAARTLGEFDDLIRQHETLVAETIGLPRAKSLYFHDFWGEVKSLGAWGGDFVLASSERTMEETRRYFNEKGLAVFLPYGQLAL